MSDLKSIAQMFGSSGVDTFLGLPACTNLDMIEAKAAILGVPVATPYKSVGNYCANAPEAIRTAIAPWAANLEHVDFDFGEPFMGNSSTRHQMVGVFWGESRSRQNPCKLFAATG